MATKDVLLEIRRTAADHGVCTDSDLRLTARQKQWACRNGLLERRYRGVYLDPSRPRTALQNLAAAVAGGGSRSRAWGPSSAALWGLVEEHPSDPHIVIPRQLHGRIPGVVVRRSSAWSWNDTMRWRGIPTTKPLLTAIDLGVVLSPMDLADVLVRARQQKLFQPGAVRAEVERVTRPGRNGVRTTRAALDLVMIGDRPADSVLELRFHHGPGKHLPPYEYQWPVTVQGHDFRIDFAYPDVKVAIEVLGYDTRKSRASLDYDALRSRLLVLAGWTVVPCTWTQVVFEGARVASDILMCLGAAGYMFCR